MLDVNHARLPFEAVAMEGIEAVRFMPQFVHRSRSNLRESSVLEAMSSLARDLGLLTFGPAPRAGVCHPRSNLLFDYVPREPIAGPVRSADETSKASFSMRA